MDLIKKEKEKNSAVFLSGNKKYIVTLFLFVAQHKNWNH